MPTVDSRSGRAARAPGPPVVAPAGSSAGPVAGVDRPAELDVDDALAIAIHMHRDGDLVAASTLYTRILDVSPDHPDALHFLGVLEHQSGRSRAAIELLIRAIERAPTAPGPWNNLANVYLECGRVDDAVRAYEQCLALAPDFADAHNNVGTIHRLRNEPALAEASYLRALEARPAFPDALNNLSKLMAGQGRTREAVLYACKTITLLPHDAEARRLLGFAHYTLGEYDKAADVFREWLVHEPDHPVALHHLAACSGIDVPPRAADAYVEQTFDAFAASFDAKLGVLGYCAPQRVAAAVQASLGPPAGDLAVLDAGCGTGLCGPLVREYARALVGVDLSARMLDKARERGVYDRLERAELVGFIASGGDRFDVILSADTLCYFGDLGGVVEATAGALRPGGLLVFTVESLDDDDAADFRLRAHGRYAHGRRHVERLLAGNAFVPIGIERAELRREGGMPVMGLIVSARSS